LRLVTPTGDAVSDRDGCAFCRIVDGVDPAHLVLDDADAVAFLDARPVFPGHVLVVPRPHVDTLTDLDTADLGRFFGVVQRVERAVRAATESPGSFVAMNNVVSQSVPHLHVHVVPRRRKDGLRGFFWPRQRYTGDDEMAATAARIRDAVE
jgi:histidine triad (HIT) family protein